MTINNFALIIGAMKCGTTSLFNYLAEHPEIAPSSEKEPAFFAKPQLLAQGFESYQNLWQWDSSKHKVALEASTAYTRCTHHNFLNAAENIEQYQDKANFKFIYIVRDPWERIEAHYNHGLAYDFPECEGVNDSYINQEIIDTSKYAMQLEQYYSRFDGDHIHLINFNDLKTDPASVLKGVCDFLELDSDYRFQSLEVVHNSKSDRRKIDLSVWNSLKKKSWVNTLAKKVPESYKTAVRNAIGKKMRPNFRLSTNQKSLITNCLREDLLSLEKKHNIDVQSWQISKHIK